MPCPAPDSRGTPTWEKVRTRKRLCCRSDVATLIQGYGQRASSDVTKEHACRSR